MRRRNSANTRSMSCRLRVKAIFGASSSTIGQGDLTARTGDAVRGALVVIKPCR
jgi:hypothetical protein